MVAGPGIVTGSGAVGGLGKVGSPSMARWLRHGKKSKRDGSCLVAAKDLIEYLRSNNHSSGWGSVFESAFSMPCTIYSWTIGLFGSATIPDVCYSWPLYIPDSICPSRPEFAERNQKGT
jgi:hypothetical protein